MNEFMEKLKTSRILGIVGNALIIIGLFLPFISMPSQVSAFMSALGIPTSFIGSGVGIVMLIAAIASLAVIFSNKIPALEKFNNQKLTLIPTAIIAFIVIGNIVNAMPTLTSGIGLGIGVWVMLIGIVAAAVYPFLYKGE